MRKLRKALLRFWLSAKRLYKKPTFLVLLLLIPILTFGYRAAAQGESGMLTVALVSQDALGAELTQELQQGSELLAFRVCETREEALRMVRVGKADAAWIFPADMAQRVARFALTLDGEDAVVEVYQRADSVTLRLAREKLGSVLFRCCAQEVYLNAVRDYAPELREMSDGELLRAYDEAYASDKLFTFSDAGLAHTAQTSYLLLPVRGLLAVVLTLGAIAAEMYFLRDTQRGVYAALPPRARTRAELRGVFAAVLSAAVSAFAALSLAGLRAEAGAEAAGLLACCACAAVFAMLLRRLCGSLRVLGALLPLLLTAMIALCPIFFSLKSLRALQYLFPPTYCLLVVQDVREAIGAAAYCAICAALCALLDRVKS